MKTKYAVVKNGVEENIEVEELLGMPQALTSSPCALAGPASGPQLLNCISAPFNRASDADIQLSNWGPDAGPASAQGEEVSACGIPSSSSTCLRAQKGVS